MDHVRDRGPQIIDVLGAAGDVPDRRFMAQGAADVAARESLLRAPGRRRRHGTGQRRAFDGHY
jgi:hypothetical protein